MISPDDFLAPLRSLAGVRAAWVERVPGVDCEVDRDGAMARLRPTHEAAVREFGGSSARWWRAEQVHGNAVATVPHASEIVAPDGLPVVPAVDGLITAEPGQLLSIYVADCGVIWLADPRKGAVGLLHSGKKGTESGILEVALRHMHEAFGSRPDDIIAVLGPCIRPPDYEVDFAATIARQATSCGVRNFIDSGHNTASDLTRFYSYRKESGKTGRMMAMILLATSP